MKEELDYVILSLAVKIEHLAKFKETMLDLFPDFDTTAIDEFLKENDNKVLN